MQPRHMAIIDGLGGHKRVASLLGLKANSVWRWYERGIPAKHWHKIIALSPGLTADHLDITKPVGVQARPKRVRRRHRATVA